MEIVTAVLTLNNLRAMVRSAHLAKSLLNDELAQVFSYLGEAELMAAKQAVSDAKLSKTPQRETTLAIGHLQSAKLHFLAASKKERSKWFATGANAAKLARGAYICDAMIASAYARLGDVKLKEHYAERFRDTFDEYYHDALKTRMLDDGLFSLLDEELKAFQLLKSLGIPAWEPMKYVPRVTEILGNHNKAGVLDDTELSALRLVHEVHITVLQQLEAGSSIEWGAGATYKDLLTSCSYTFLQDPMHSGGIIFDNIRPKLVKILQVMDGKGSYIKSGTDQLTSG